ncbi:MAG: NADH-quinone oxidoreductase subunit M [Verrucomicrobiota bacterium]|nr:NADH-quinone oxidoreductase subunit M [Verrucomicrobiota bacterium]
MNLLTLTLCLPLVGAICIGLFPLKGREAYWAALTASILMLLCTLRIAWIFQDALPEGDSLFRLVEFYPWFPDLNLSYKVGIDGISLTLLILTSIVTVAAVGVSAHVEESPRTFFAGLLLISAGAFGAFISLDLMLLYIFHELALIPTFLLIGFWGSSTYRERVATKLTIYLTAGSLLLLIGLLAFYFLLPPNIRTFDMEALRLSLSAPNAPTGLILRSHELWVYPLILFGFGILISLFPFHTWAPQGYANAPTAVAMLHAGVLKKFGLYGIIRVSQVFLPFGAMSYWMDVLAVLLLCNIIYVGYVAMAEKDMNYMLGFSSVSHMGYIFLGIISHTLIGISGAIFLMFAHGLTASLGFAISGYVYRKTGTRDMTQLGGLAKSMPFMAVLFGMVAFASAGLPGFGNFAAEILIFFGAWDKHRVVTIIALWGVVISSVYMLRAFRNVFLGDLKPTQDPASVITMSYIERLPYLLLISVLVIIGFCPSLLLNLIKPGVEQWFVLIGK